MDTTDRRKISSDQKRLFFAALSFFTNTPFKSRIWDRYFTKNSSLVFNDTLQPWHLMLFNTEENGILLKFKMMFREEFD